MGANLPFLVEVWLMFMNDKEPQTMKVLEGRKRVSTDVQG